MVASVRSTSTGVNTGGNTVTFTPPTGIVTGDLWIVETLTGTATGYFTDNIPKGWWKLEGVAANTRQYQLLARIYNSSDSTSNYTLTQNAGAATKYASVAVRDHAVTQQSDIIVGTRWIRGENGGSIALITAPSVTTTSTDAFVMAFTGEASNALGSYTTTTPNGFTKAVEITEGGTASTDIEWVSIWTKVMSTAGASGAFQITYTTTSNNGVGQQIAFASKVVAPPTVGLIGNHAVTYAGETALNVGLNKLGGTSVSVVLYNSAGTTEVQRKTLTADGTTSWGSVSFTGLTADTVYTVKFEVDSITQTDAQIVRAKTKKTAGVPVSFVTVGGSCQFTASNHPVFRAMAAKNPEFISHMGDLHYANPTTDSAWRTAVNQSMSTSNFQYMLDRVPFNWTWDNHDRIILDAGASASPLNMGYTDPATNTQWRTFSGAAGDYLSSDTVGRMWRVGRVMFIQTDNWTKKDDPDAVAEPRTFLGSAQKQAFKDALQLANDSSDVSLVVWWCSWTALNNGNGRWDSYPTETAELEAFIDARPAVKRKLVLIGGDSHSLQADSGTRTGSQYRFKGVPSLNISGFNRNSWTGDGTAGWDIANGAITVTNTPEQGWGTYSLLTITDNGASLRFRWEARRVHDDGSNNYTEDVIAYFERTYGSPIQEAYVGTTPVEFVSLGDTRLWQKEVKGSEYTPASNA